MLDASEFRLLIFTGAHPSAQTVKSIQAVIDAALPHAAYVQPLIIFGGQDASAFAGLTRSVVIDPTLELHFRYDAQKGAIYLVRPDLYVGYNAYGFDAHQLKVYLARLFAPGLPGSGHPLNASDEEEHGFLRRVHLPAFLVHH